jgi:uncharacterized membrane protein YccC
MGKLFSNKNGYISLLIYTITFIASANFEQPTVFFFITLSISVISGLFFSIWVVIKLINYFINKSKR